MKDHRKEIYDTESRRLARIVDAGHDPKEVCGEGELKAVWKHQLEAPLTSDLSISRRKLEEAQLDAQDSPVTFGHLLQSGNPPLALLEKVKDFGKASWASEESPLPPKIGTMLYFAAVAAARERCDTPITSLGRLQLRRGVKWCHEQEWVDPDTRALFKAYLKSTKKGLWPFSWLFGM